MIDDILALQDEIAATIAARLRLSLAREPHAAPTRSLGARELYLRGRSRPYRWRRGARWRMFTGMPTSPAIRLAALSAAALAWTACSRAVVVTTAPSTGTPPPATADCCSNAVLASGLRIAERYRVDAITTRRFTHEEYWRAITPFTSSAGLRTEQVGASMLGRAIRTVTFGTGPTTVFLWSQMHGDESAASMALADIFRFFAEGEGDVLRERLRRNLTVTFIPLLNPDGAEVFQRENAIGIDVNRDARRLVTPEAQTLKQVRDALRPQFGFNLHDQNARSRVGPRGLPAGIALLAPAYDAEKSYNDVRSRARLVAATVAQVLAHDIPGRVAKYDDTFNPRAFGDLMQQWGTSTVLIESGALPGDPQKQRLRALNVAAILGALDAIATGSYRNADPAVYDALPFNTGGAVDLLVQGGRVVLPGRAPMLVDLAINYDDAVARTGGRVRDVGDLQGTTALDTIDASGLFLHPRSAALHETPAGAMLRLGAPAEFDVRRGADPASALVRRIGGEDGR